MKIYTDDEDEALSLLKESAEAAENNSYIAINIAYWSYPQVILRLLARKYTPCWKPLPNPCCC